MARYAEAALVIDCARSWIGTPYRHQASCKGGGTDCLGLLRGVWREVVGREPEAPPSYTADWAEASGDEVLLEAAARHLLAAPDKRPAPGRVLVMRMRKTAIAKHVGIVAARPDGALTLVHAYSGHGVVESPLSGQWLRLAAGVFCFPAQD